MISLKHSFFVLLFAYIMANIVNDIHNINPISIAKETYAIEGALEDCMDTSITRGNYTADFNNVKDILPMCNTNDHVKIDRYNPTNYGLTPVSSVDLILHTEFNNMAQRLIQQTKLDPEKLYPENNPVDDILTNQFALHDLLNLVSKLLNARFRIINFVNQLRQAIPIFTNCLASIFTYIVPSLTELRHVTLQQLYTHHETFVVLQKFHYILIQPLQCLLRRYSKIKDKVITVVNNKVNQIKLFNKLNNTRTIITQLFNNLKDELTFFVEVVVKGISPRTPLEI